MSVNPSVQKRALPIIRVFVSSTFSDLKHERNALHAQVWPELERYCQQRGFTFQAIDLRWGVPAEAGLDHRTMRICFEELRRSQDTSPEPNFLILLGNRYGWRPLPEAISVEEFKKLKAAAKLIQSEPVDPARKMTDKQMALLKKAVAILEDWYLLDENARPFGDETRLGEYVLRSRKTSFDGVDYGRQPGATGKLRDTAAWVDVQFVLWSIVNRAFPASGLKDRFAMPLPDNTASDRAGTRESSDLKSHDFSYVDRKPLPSIVRFKASAKEQEIWAGALGVPNASQHVLAFFREIDPPQNIGHAESIKDYCDLVSGEIDSLSLAAQRDLKAEIKKRLGDNCIDLPRVRLSLDKDQSGEQAVRISTDHIDELCHEVETRLTGLIPIAIWSRLRSDLAPYLTERAAPGGNVLTLYHRQVAEWAKARFVDQANCSKPGQDASDREPRARLTKFFAKQDYFLESLEDQRARARRLPPTPRPSNIRKVDELPWQLLEVAKHFGKDDSQSPHWNAIVDLFTDLNFLEAKAEAAE